MAKYLDIDMDMDHGFTYNSIGIILLKYGIII